MLVNTPIPLKRIALLAAVMPGIALAAVDHIEVESSRATTVPGIDAIISTKAFDAADNPEDAFDITYDVVEPNGGTLGPNEDCEGEPPGSNHCATYSPPDVDGTYHVRATLVSDPTISEEAEIQVVHCAPYPADGGNLACEGPIISPGFDHKGDLRLGVILLEPQDFQSANDAERQQFRDDQTARFFGANDSVKDWFNENAIGESQLLGNADDVFGPYELTHDWGEYFQLNGQLRWGDGQGICFQDEGAALADTDLEYEDYNRIYFVVKGDNTHQVWGWTNSIWNRSMNEGCIKVSSARDGDQSNWQVAGHEFSHTMYMTQGMGSTPDLYKGAAANRVGDWDIMDHHNKGSQHTMAIKWAGEWIKPDDIFTMPRPVGNEEKDETVVLGPSGAIENDPDVFRTILIPVTDRKNYFVGVRKGFAGNTSDQQLPGTGVIITDWTPNPSLLGEDRAQVLLEGGLLSAVNDEYDEMDPIDPTRRLRVTLTNVNGDNHTVRVRWKQFRADPYIRPWTPPPYESVDIWNDCPLNNESGTVVYEDADNAGNPRGRGDQPCYGVTNTLQARIHNGGNQQADNVTVSFYWVDPSIGEPEWNFIGTDTLNIPAGGNGEVSTSWIPISNPAHQCIKVIVGAFPGELNPSNNQAQENFHVQESPSGSPYQPATMAVDVNNPFDYSTYVRLGFHDLADGWKVDITKRFVRLLPRETKTVRVTVTPPEKERDKAPDALISIAGMAYTETHDESEQLVHIGGVSILTKGVDPTPELRLAVAPDTVGLGNKVDATIDAFPLVDRPVAVVFKGPNGEEDVVVGRTDVERNMALDYLPTAAGDWTAQARFMGEGRHGASESRIADFTVIGGKDGAGFCTQLCKRDYVVLWLILLVSLLILVLLWRRAMS